ncbi:MAG: MarR family transcriptional regulator [Firmicutes bacterium]|jgi:DNA-binding MarR family transcriptional regulator|nr:MarR family transcriptional regulator [Bacillota bacterium]
MEKQAEHIASLVGMLPVFIGAVLEGIEISTPYKLSESEEKTLMFLHHNEGSPMTAYSKKVGLTRGSFTGVVDRLQEKGLVERAPVSCDRRKYALMLTTAGKNVARDIDAQFKRHIAAKMALLPPRERDKLAAALETIIAAAELLTAGKEG